MSRIPLKVVRISIRAYHPNGFPQKLGNLVTGEVKHLALFHLVDRDEHIVRLMKLASL